MGWQEDNGLSTAFLSNFVSSVVGHRVEVVWSDYREMQRPNVGEANWQTIRLHTSLAQTRDSFLPTAFFHELGHVMLHKRREDPDFKITDEECEREAKTFAATMVLRLGDDFVWHALDNCLSYELESRAKTEIKTFANSKIFKRNRIVQPYQRASQGDVEVKWHRQPQASVHHRRQMTASELEAQGRRELALAAKVSNPDVAAMIKRSAQEKLGTPANHGRRSGASYSDAPFEKATLRR